MNLPRHLLSITVLSVLLSAPLCRGSLLETNVSSKFIGQRHIQVYLPPSYDTQPEQHYPVLYLHDGQNVFSSAGTNIAFGWGNWGLDKTVDALSRAGKMREIILVAVDNADRLKEYSGRHHEPAATTNTAFENYTSFLIEELKPQVDREFRTLPDAANTGVMGSSLGGLCSLVLAWDHPEVFGRAASLSGSFQFEKTNFLKTELEHYHGEPKAFRIYLDSGVVDFTGGNDGRNLTAQVAAELRRIGWTTNLELFVDAKPLTPVESEAAGLRPDKWAEAQTSQHNEFYWRQRVWRPLTFLFPVETGKH